MRLKMNLSLSLLSCIFRISTPTTSRTFRNTIEAIHARLVPALMFWPNREELQHSSQCPWYLDRSFVDVPVLLTALNFFLSKAKRPKSKSTDQLKILTSPYHEDWYNTTRNSVFHIKRLWRQNIRQTLD